jgi:formylglycine-generating enzyme required for sulfatase activity
VAIAAGDAMLGQDPSEFGWDNEFPQHNVTVDAFEIARHKLTNGEYERFVAQGGTAPHFWHHRDGGWWLRRMFDEIPLPLDAPVYLTQQQAVAYAAWSGTRLPTEAEWQFAAYGAEARRYPWGDAEPDASRANLEFVDWDPLPVTAHPTSATPQGLEQMVGNGWEWTATPFAGFDGFSPRPYYPGYSANFFDGAHYVMKGASPRTARRLARPSFRNWFRAEYPYAYATARLARD